MVATEPMRGVETLNRVASRSPQIRRVLVEVSKRAQAQGAVNALRRDATPLEEKFAAALESQLRELGSHVADTMTPLMANSRFMEARWRSDLARTEVESLVSAAVQQAALREWVQRHFTPRFVEHYDEVQKSVGRSLIRAGFASNLTQERVAQILQSGGRRAGLVDIVGQTREALFRTIERGMEAGLNPRETARIIREFVPEGRFVNAGAGYRAQLIARTETLHAQRMASLERYRSGQIRTVLAFDGDKDEQCAARNGVEFTIDDAEAEMALTHPNCVLAFGPVAL